jgi:hypothetical protein
MRDAVCADWRGPQSNIARAAGRRLRSGTTATRSRPEDERKGRPLAGRADAHQHLGHQPPRRRKTDQLAARVGAYGTSSAVAREANA